MVSCKEKSILSHLATQVLRICFPHCSTSHTHTRRHAQLGMRGVKNICSADLGSVPQHAMGSRERDKPEPVFPGQP
ncbi:hypothetical protein BRADI_4g01057v3 [Brachypodium distachyon]|uniref:Uncharacterized protein n=1 Tax=Brachypodium distachyon TaxID=15368 RepID=A0A0Q3HC58_BRADI|nr:hypothetical protein BRADI_4g01057v3 [Brachypodium distachyon]